MRYDERKNLFVQTQHKSLIYSRHFVGIYGWIVGFGTPPRKHLDVMAPTSKTYALGDVVSIRIIGCFKRNDNDDKYIAVEAERKEQTIRDLPISELTMLQNLYPIVREGEGWLESDDALAMIRKHGGGSGG